MKKKICEKCNQILETDYWGAYGRYKILCNVCYSFIVDNAKSKKKLIRKLNNIYLNEVKENGKDNL